MSQLTRLSRLKPNPYLRQLRAFLTGLRFGVVFLRVRWFKMPQKVKAAGKSIPLVYSPDVGVLGVFLECFVYNAYGFRQQLSGIRTILDIGANIGLASVAARAYYPYATIHAYEPNPRTLPFLKANTAQIGITVYPEAVGGKSGYVSILDAPATGHARTLSSDEGSVPQVTLQTAVDRLGGSVDLLKLDCEGAEWELFQTPEPWSRIRDIRMEYHLFGSQSIGQVEEALASLGFQITRWARRRFRHYLGDTHSETDR